MKLIVTIPAYNEEKNISQVVRSIQLALKGSGHAVSVVVVDDGSTDRTVAIAKKAGAEVVSHQANFGLAEAFRTEMRECLKRDADIIVHIDADGQYRAEEIPLLVRKIEEGYHLVLGSRFLGWIEEMPLIKRLGNRAFSRVISRITGITLSDGQTGFRAFTKNVAELPVLSGYTYTQEQIIRAAKAKLRICEVPVHFDKRGKKTKSRLMKGPIDYALKAGVNLLRVYRDYEPLKFFGWMGAGILGLGVLLGVFILATLLGTGTVGGIPRVVLSAMLILTGIQVIFFGFLADMWKK